MIRPTVAWTLLPLLLSGCLGYNRVLFVTKSNVGLEASTTPPTLQLALARTEGVVAPQFENGKKLPVLASFKFSNERFFGPAVGSAFATGDAATTLAALYSEPTPPGDWTNRATWVCTGLPRCQPLPTDSTLVLTNPPEIRPPFPANLLPTPTFQAADVRPVFFGTDTSLGIKLAWSTMSSTFPDSARFGYHRKELAFVPIAREAPSESSAGHKLRMSSLMATVDSGTTGDVASQTPGLDYQHLQYFATGNAATLLALQRDVRQAMLVRLDPNLTLHKARFAAGLSPGGRILAFNVLRPIYAVLADMQATSPDAKALVDRLDALSPAGLAYDYPVFAFNLARGELVRETPLLEGRPFERLHTYKEQLDLSIRALEAALVAENLATIEGVPVTDKAQARTTLYRMIGELQAKRMALDAKLREASGVFAQAVEFFFR